PLARADLTACLLTPFRLLWLTARLFVDPSALSPLWNPDALLPARSLRDADVWGGMILAGLWIVLIVRGCRRGRAVGVWALVFAWFMLLPLHVVPVASWLFAERWLYLPSVALAIVAAGVVSRYGRWAALAGVCAAIVLLPQTWAYASAWRSDVSMNRYVLEAHPDNFHAANNLAWVYFVEKRYEDSLRVASELADRFPDAWEPYVCMSETYAALGDTQRAREARAEADTRRTAALLQLR
ncbi:MAG: tetratricopeptide repeat protein, partial [Phycisphaerae bacterium]